MNENLFIKLTNKSPLFCHYAFLDTNPRVSRQVFQKHKIFVWVDSLYSTGDEKYSVALCRVRKKDQKKFEEALEALAKTMLVLGNTDYLEKASALLTRLDSE